MRWPFALILTFDFDVEGPRGDRCAFDGGVDLHNDGLPLLQLERFRVAHQRELVLRTPPVQVNLNQLVAVVADTERIDHVCEDREWPVRRQPEVEGLLRELFEIVSLRVCGREAGRLTVMPSSSSVHLFEFSKSNGISTVFGMLSLGLEVAASDSK